MKKVICFSNQNLGNDKSKNVSTRKGSAEDELPEAAEDVQPAKGHVVHFYTAMVEFILTFSITIWYTAFTAKDKSRLQQIIHST